MLMTKERPRAIRTLRGWAIHVLQGAGAIHECEEHGWAKEVPIRKRESTRWPSPGRPPDRLVSGSGGGRGPRTPGFDRRYLPGMHALTLARERT